MQGWRDRIRHIGLEICGVSWQAERPGIFHNDKGGFVMSKYVIETRNLTKQYGAQKSVASLNIHVQKGRIYGLLGRNGA